MKNILFILFSSLLISSGYGQTRFITEGKVEFERKLNLHAQMTGDDAWITEWKKNSPQFKTSYFDLSFTNNKTFYKPGKENAENNRMWEQPAEENIIYSDLEKHTAVSQKKIFEKIFFDDTLSKPLKIKS